MIVNQTMYTAAAQQSEAFFAEETSSISSQESSSVPAQESSPVLHEEPSPIATQESSPAQSKEQQYLAGAFGMLATLLRSVPDTSVLERVALFAELDVTGDDLTVAMSMLGLAASSSSQQSVDDEFHDLFIGMGRGELVPYGSWYQTGYLMERPLSQLRDDLVALGFQRNPDVHEPEDHVAALCEVMAMLILDGADIARQSHFFETHMSGWLMRFFSDLSEAKSAVFYRSVGRFGMAITALEQRYLAMPS